MWRLCRNKDGVAEAVRYCKTSYSDGSVTVDVAKDGSWKLGSTEMTVAEFEEQYGDVIKEFAHKTSCMKYIDEHAEELQ